MAKTKKSAVKKVPKQQKAQDDDEPEVFFIPAGVLLGMGLGFLYRNLVAGLFIGLGVGFTIFAILAVVKSRK
ncbi:MAG: hypothetical protein ACMXYK_04845 [Candidatus Woesearchaeota archaeon]